MWTEEIGINLNHGELKWAIYVCSLITIRLEPVFAAEKNADVAFVGFAVAVVIGIFLPPTVELS